MLWSGVNYILRFLQVSGVIKTDMTVRAHHVNLPRTIAYHSYTTGEILEKATRALTEEDRKTMDTEWVGKTGEKRKLEVRIHLTRGFFKLI